MDGSIPQRGVSKVESSPQGSLRPEVEPETRGFPALIVTERSSGLGPSLSCEEDARKAILFPPKPLSGPAEWGHWGKGFAPRGVLRSAEGLMPDSLWLHNHKREPKSKGCEAPGNKLNTGPGSNPSSALCGPVSLSL